MEQKNPFESSNGLRVTDRTSQSISLAWPPLNAVPTNQLGDEGDGGDGSGDGPAEASLKDNEVAGTEGNEQESTVLYQQQRDGNWTEIQMRKEQLTDWAWVYKGYGCACKIDGLASDLALVFRMKRNDEVEWGTEVVGSTAPSPPSAEDLNRAVEMNSSDLVSRILKLTRPLHLKKILTARDRNGMTPLMVACHIGNAGIAEKLIRAGCDVNAQSSGACRTALMFASIVGHQSVVTILDHHKVNWRLRDRSGSNAMDYAITGGHVGILKLALYRLGSRCIHQTDNRHGWTPLMRAAVQSDSLDVLRFLILKGANPNSIDRYENKTVLLAAILRKKPDFVRYLLEKGADPFLENQNGKNCVEMARILGYREIREILTEHVAAMESNENKS